MPAIASVLSGMPSYYDMDDSPTDTMYGSPPSNPLNGMPSYYWWYGCTPTSAGMLVGYWDSLPGYQDLYYGDASVWTWSTTANTATSRMIASVQDIVAGQQNKYTYGYYGNCTSYPNHLANPNCMADFLQTVDGGTNPFYTPIGLQNFVEWTDPSPTNPLKKGYACTTAEVYAPGYQTGGNLNISTVETEINAGRPVLLDVSCWYGGHSIAVYGYQPNMFEVRVQVSPTEYDNELVAGVAVQDTWGAGGTGGSSWYDWTGGTFSSYIDHNGVEWWPFVLYPQYESHQTLPVYNWEVMDAVTLDIYLPEPSTLFWRSWASAACWPLHGEVEIRNIVNPERKTSMKLHRWAFGLVTCLAAMGGLPNAGYCVALWGCLRTPTRIVRPPIRWTLRPLAHRSTACRRTIGGTDARQPRREC